MLVKQLTAIGVTLIVTALTGLGVGILYLQTATAGPPGADDVAPAAAQGKQNDARPELQRLTEELQKLRKKAAALEARVAELERVQPEALYRGKPASHWTRALRDRDPKYRQEALEALGCLAEVDRSLVPILVGSLLNDTDDQVRETACTQLIARVGEPALPLLIAALKDTRQDRRNWAVFTLGRFFDGGKPAVAALTALLKSSKKTDRLVAAEALGQIGPDAAAAVPALVELLKDRSIPECSVAISALGRIGGSAKAALPLLIDMLQDRALRKLPFDRSVQPVLGGQFEYTPAIAATIALGQMGPAAEAALPALREAARDTRMRDYAPNAIRNIEAATKKND